MDQSIYIISHLHDISIYTTILGHMIWVWIKIKTWMTTGSSLCLVIVIQSFGYPILTHSYIYNPGDQSLWSASCFSSMKWVFHENQGSFHSDHITDHGGYIYIYIYIYEHVYVYYIYISVFIRWTPKPKYQILNQYAVVRSTCFEDVAICHVNKTLQRKVSTSRWRNLFILSTNWNHG